MANPRTGSTSLRDLLDPFSDIRSVHISEITEDFPFYHHISALELKRIFKERGWDWDAYTKFTVVRNPYDRVVSLWHHYQWMCDEGYCTQEYKSFEQYVKNINTKDRLSTSLSNFICDENNIQLIDDVLMFETFSKVLPSYLHSLNIHIDDIPHLNKSVNRSNYIDYNNTNTIALISELYQEEIKQFGYIFKSNIHKESIMEDKEFIGNKGGAWDEEMHMVLHPENFNHGMANFIVNQIKPKSVLEFGSGLGFLSRHIVDTMHLTNVICIEPNEIKSVYDNINGPKLLPIDIFTDNHPHTLNQKFDLVMSIEVAEHIDREKHDDLFDFLVSHTNNWIVFSGARVGQGGHGHISERPEEEWKEEFSKRGMFFQEELTHSIRTACDEKNINHKQNLMFFKRPEGYEALDTMEQKARPYLRDILSIVQQKGDHLQGNLFYVDLQDAINGMPVDNLKEKRRNLTTLIKSKKNVLEIGFNAGHSALIMLLENKEMNLTIIDIGHEPYMEACFHYLKILFPGRLKLIKGDSTQVIEQLDGEKFDLIHYDGGKEHTIYQDLKNTSTLVADDHILLIDDTQNKDLENIVLDFTRENFIELRAYQFLSKKTDAYKWKHVIATFVKDDQTTLIETVLQKLQPIYDHNQFASIYTNNNDIKLIGGYNRASSLINILQYVNNSALRGDFVECGVAAGHSSVIAALTLQELNNEHIHLYLYDTYHGFDFPLADEIDLNNKSIKEYDLSRYQTDHTSTSNVFNKLIKTELQPARISMIEGMVEDTIPKYIPKCISILRLDVDLYQPTLHCLEEMFPLLESGGYLIIDDYGHWEGCKKAVQEFFTENNLNLDALEYVDYTCRVYKK